MTPLRHDGGAARQQPPASNQHNLSRPKSTRPDQRPLPAALATAAPGRGGITGLAVPEVAALVQHEAAIEAERDGFVARTSSHLLAIRNGRLYRADFATFEDYCQKRWGLTKTHVNRIIQHAQVVDAVTPTGVKPSNEAQARELAPLLEKPEALLETWRQAVEQTDGKPTAAAIREARNIVAPVSPRLQRAPPPEPRSAGQ